MVGGMGAMRWRAWGAVGGGVGGGAEAPAKSTGPTLPGGVREPRRRGGHWMLERRERTEGVFRGGVTLARPARLLWVPRLCTPSPPVVLLVRVILGGYVCGVCWVVALEVRACAGKSRELLLDGRGCMWS
ncbi:hypothetical protein Tco_0485230 [Tanacetum coccineum]